MAFPGIGTIGNIISGVGTALRLPEMGISEAVIDPTRSIFTASPNNLSKGPTGGVGDTQAKTAPDPSGQYAGGSGGGAAAEKAAAINQINRLLGNIGVQRDQGLARIDQSVGTASNRLTEDQKRAMLGYDQQTEQNAKEKLSGTENVDRFANNSFTSLQRLLQGANAGNSSVMRDLVPQLVAKSAGTRRQGVFNTFGENQQGIDLNRADAETQFSRARTDLENQAKAKREDFLRSILESEQSAYDQLASLSSGGSAAAARSAAEARQGQLNALFGQFNPSIDVAPVNTKTSDLSQYTVDPAKIAQQGLPSETAYYLPQIKKRQAAVAA